MKDITPDNITLDTDITMPDLIAPDTDGTVRMVEVKDPGLTDTLKRYEKYFTTLSPRKQSRVVFSRKFRQALRVSGISQKELAKIIGVSAPLVSGWANAQSMPSSEHLAKLSEVFGTDVNEWTEPPSMVEAARKPAESGKISELMAQHTMSQREKEEMEISSVPITTGEKMLIYRVRRMSQAERDALYTLLHVFA